MRKRDGYEITVSKNDLQYAIFAITKACNLRCRWCFENSKPSVGEKALTKQEIIDIIRKLHGLKSISISGGEASLHPDIIEILRETKEACEDPHLLSNGTLISKKILDFLSEEGIRLTISIDGMEKNHDFIRGVGTFNKAIHTVREAVSLGIKTSMQCTLSMKNRSDIESLIRLAEDIGVAHISFMRMKPLGRGSPLEDETLSASDLRETIIEVNELKKQVKVDVIFKDPLDNTFDEPLQKMALDAGCVAGGCRAGVESIFIDNKGDIFPCPFFREKIGNALQENPFQVFCESPILRRLRFSANYNDKCRGCKRWLVCRGCRAEPWMRTGDYLGADAGCWQKIFDDG